MRAIVCINTSHDLWQESYELEYDDIKIEIERWDDHHWHQIRAEYVTDADFRTVHEKIRRFLSEICWLYGCNVEILTYWGASNKQSRFDAVPQYFNRIKWGLYLNDYQQIAFNLKQQVALSIHREAINSKSVFYEFFCYSRIINLIWNQKIQWIQWINDNIKYIKRNKDQLQKIQTIITSNPPSLPSNWINNVWDHLYYSSRCAIAHASPDLVQVADPDNFEHYDRIFKEVHLMNELVEIFINKELLIPTHSELSSLQVVQWFESHYGKVVFDQIKTGVITDPRVLPSLPKVSMKLKGINYDFSSLKNLEFKLVSIEPTGILYFNNYHQQDHNFLTGFAIDLANQKMLFDYEQLYNNPKTRDSDKQQQIDYLTLLKYYLKNGSLELYDQSNNNLITRTENHIFVNCDVDSCRKLYERIDTDLAKLLPI